MSQINPDALPWWSWLALLASATALVPAALALPRRWRAPALTATLLLAALVALWLRSVGTA